MRDATVVTGQDSDGNKHAGVAGWSVPGYTELKALGSGGFGDVVLARHDATGTLVAIKYVRRKLLADPQWPQMFRAEAQVLAILDDPNIVRLYEYVESPYGAAIVMELIDGVSVREILAHQGGTTPEAALVVLQGSLLGLAAAHRRGVVHRDYKPENVLVDGNGGSKLTDFGIAARTGEEPVAGRLLAVRAARAVRRGPGQPGRRCLRGHGHVLRVPDRPTALHRGHGRAAALPAPDRAGAAGSGARAAAAAGRRRDGQGALEPADRRDHLRRRSARRPRRRVRPGLGGTRPVAPGRGGAAAGGAVAVRRVARRPGLRRGAGPPRPACAGIPGIRGISHIWHVRHLLHLEHLRHLRRSAKAIIAGAAAIVVVAAGATVAVALSGNGGHGHLTAQSGPTSASQSPSQGPTSPASTLPAVTGTSPASGTTGGGTLVTIIGTHLDGPVTVNFGAKPGTITVDLNTKIMVKSPPGQGTVEITVTTPAGTGKAGEFSYHSPSMHMAAPAVTGVSPATGPAAGGTLVAITGTNLADVTMVSFGGVAGMISSDSATQITVSAPPGKGTVDVMVTTPGGTSTAGMFTYTSSSAPPPARPVVTGLSPSSGAAGGGTSVAITGSGLASAGKVSFGGAAGTITADSGSRITVKSPPGKGTVTVTVTTSGGTATAGKFSYKASTPPPPAAPVVTGISPNSGPAAGGTSVTITGKNLSDATGVSFGGAGAKITADSSTKITATSPSGSGTVNITVTTKGGTSALQRRQVHLPAPPPAPMIFGSPRTAGAQRAAPRSRSPGRTCRGATSVSFGGTARRSPPIPARRSPPPARPTTPAR